ncbi:MAG TPA: flagellar biosynthesis anti-sigma factor FlgM [Vicinamibacterales bacterium]|nr:flagellar biosynthesis anti-sigma factor FlgM [Vicinamibacterales bacterium]
MKIDQNRAHLDTVGNVRPEPVRDERTAAAERATADKAADQVRVSTTGQLAATAASAAEQASDVRPDVVERARKLLASGELGRDAERLADTLIDNAIDSAIDKA